MKITCLGTGAADFLPSLEHEDRYTLDKNIRRCTATLLDEHTLIDCGPHLLDELDILAITPERIEQILVTHTHADHFCPEAVQALQKRIGRPVHLWYHQQLTMPELDGVIYHPMALDTPCQIGAMQVTPLAANHVQGAVHYSIVSGGRKLFYGCDGAWFLYDTYYYMKNQRYDVMILDATVGDHVGDYRLAEHNSIPMLRLMMPSLRTWGAVDEHTVIVLDHLARTLHKPYEETCKIVKDDGFVVAYDGMSLEIQRAKKVF